jgi:decaprenyl-phosphate phosphoribosyltransferase
MPAPSTAPAPLVDPLPGSGGAAQPALRRRPAPGFAVWTRAVRVRQWPKNVLIFGAPIAGGVLLRPGVLGRVSLAALAFCLLSSGAYLLNDVHDAAEDRRHPVKRHRPIASGAIVPARAVAVGVALILTGLSLAGSQSAELLAVAGGYALLNFAYTGWLRRIAIADIAAIAAAFVLRAGAGGVAAGIPMSRWFLVVVSFSALLVAAGKRYSEYLDPSTRRSRTVLREYNADFLLTVIGAGCAVALGAYCLWAFQGRPALAWREVTVVPFTIALLRYALLVTGGRAAAPEEVLLGDRFIQVVGLAWVLTFSLGL